VVWLIGSISCGFEHLNIFLTKDEIEKLNTQTLEGALAYLVKPYTENSLTLTVDDEKSKAICVDVQLFDRSSCSIFISREYHQILKESGDIGARYTAGNKITIIEESKAEHYDSYHKEQDLSVELRDLKRYFKNKNLK